MPIRCILYARFSPRPDAAECDSCDKQLADLRAHAAKLGWEVVAELRDEDESGEDRSREGLRDAIGSLKRGYVLLVRNWDRLARDVFFTLFVAEDVERRGARLHSMAEGDWSHDDDPTKKLLSTIFAAFAEYQRVMAAARTRRAMRRHQASGRNMSSIAPYGWEFDPDRLELSKRGNRPRHMRPVESEQAIIARIKTEWAEGATLRAIARRLNDEGVPCRLGAWSHIRIKAVLVREGVIPLPKKRRSHHSP